MICKVYLKEILKIDLLLEVLLMFNLVGYLWFFYLVKDKVLCVEKLVFKWVGFFFWVFFGFYL